VPVKNIATPAAPIYVYQFGAQALDPASPAILP
jgi:hypothetical protein